MGLGRDHLNRLPGIDLTRKIFTTEGRNLSYPTIIYQIPGKDDRNHRGRAEIRSLPIPSHWKRGFSLTTPLTSLLEYSGAAWGYWGGLVYGR